MLYSAYQAQSDLAAPLRAAAGVTKELLAPLVANPLTAPAFAGVAAAAEIVARSGLTHVRPHFGIDDVRVDGDVVPVREEAVDRTPFGTLLRFAKDASPPDQPRVLLVAPMSGHFATLLRHTVRTLLAEHDVYVTDWHNARDVPLAHGPFAFDDYAGHLIRWMQRIGPGAHMVAVCQPCVSALVATSVMAEGDDPAVPRSLTLMAGPIDARVNPTSVDALATERPLSWFERNVITSVPWRYRGAGRRVYPGFLQISGFVRMNLGRHVRAHRDLFFHVVRGDHDLAQASRDFYDEYFAVHDLTADFYLETIRDVFQEFRLARGVLDWGGRRVDPGAVGGTTALLTVEGERDDICAPGQTAAAHDLCTGVDPARRHHHLQAGVGHYGVFSGRRWEREIFPVVREVIRAAD